MSMTAGNGAIIHESDGDLAAPAATTSGEESQTISEPSDGDASIGSGGGETGEESHAEEVPGGSESEQAVVEATAEQLAAPAASGSAISDLRALGFEEGSAEESTVFEAATDGMLPDAGTGISGGQEFLPLLTSLASSVLPTLASTAGPAIAKAVFGRLSNRAKRILDRRRPGADPVAVLTRHFTQARSAESGAESVDEATVAEVTSVIEVILGTDDRIRIRTTTQPPWRWICALRIQFPSGAAFRGTGFLIGRYAVATAGHCLYLPKEGWAKRVEVIPGCDGQIRPLGSVEATGMRSTAGWVKQGSPEADYGVMFLPRNAFGGRDLGYFGFAAYPDQILLAEPAVLAGYPGDKPFADLWGMTRRISAVSATQLTYQHDTAGGQSGSGPYITRNGKRYVVGVHNYGSARGNTATRITPAVYRNLALWVVASNAAG